MRAIQSCENIKERDYSDAFEVLLGKKAANVLNVFISHYSLGHLMKYSCLMLALVRKFVMGIAFRGKYDDFKDFKRNYWGRPFIKYPFMAGVAIIEFSMCLMTNMSKLNFLGT